MRNRLLLHGAVLGALFLILVVGMGRALSDSGTLTISASVVPGAHTSPPPPASSFTITLNAGASFASTPTVAFVDKWLDSGTDPNNFQNLGAWVTTGPNGIASQTASAYCNPDIDGHILHQRVYIAYGADGSLGRSPEARYDVDCRPVAKSTCTATLSWDKTSINPGDSATETWTVTDGISAVGTCSNTDKSLDRTAGISLGPQSYTFSNIQKSITCSVIGLSADGSTCTSGDKTVAVSAGSAPTFSCTGALPSGFVLCPGTGAKLTQNRAYASVASCSADQTDKCEYVPAGTITPAPTSTSPNSPVTTTSGQIMPGYTGCPNLFWHSMNAAGAWHWSFAQNMQLTSDPSYDWYWGGLEEYWASDNISFTALDPLPPGLVLTSHPVNYPDNNMNNDGLNTTDFVNKDIKAGFPTLTRYSLAGAPTQQGSWTVRFQATKSPSCTQTGTFQITVTPPPPPQPPTPRPPAIPTAPSSTNGLISFVKTVIYADPPPDGAQMLGDMTAWGRGGGKFVISGEYGGSLRTVGINGQSNSGGGGLWTLNEDGTGLRERDAALDAGSGSNVIYQHGHRHASFAINLEWNKGGFVMENASWGSCLSGGVSGYCTEYGPGANQAVYYTQGADGFPAVAGRSGKNQDNPLGLIVLKSKVISTITGNLYTLPKFVDEGPAGLSPDMGGVTFGDNIINSRGEVFSVAADGSSVDATGQKLLDDGYIWANYAWDWSGGFPPKLGIWEVKTQSDPGVGMTISDAKIKVYALAADGSVVPDRTMSAPIKPGIANAGYIVSFGLWGNYIVTSDYATTTTIYDGLNGRNFTASPIYVWQGDAKIDTVMMPIGTVGFAGGHPFAISKNGYVLINASWNAPRQDLVYLYKLNLKPGTTVTLTPTPTSTTPVIPPYGGGPGGPPVVVPAPSSTDPCIQKYGQYCDQITALQKQICALVPTADICK